MGNDNFTDEERRNQESAVEVLMRMFAASRMREHHNGLDPQAKEMHLNTAKVYKQLYDSYVEAGFTKEQAFDLVKIDIKDIKDFKSSSLRRF